MELINNKKTTQSTKTLIFTFSSSAGVEMSLPTRFPQQMWLHRRVRRKSEYTWPFLCQLVMSLWSVSLTMTWESLVKSLILVSVRVCCFIRKTSDMTQICGLVFVDKCGDVFWFCRTTENILHAASDWSFECCCCTSLAFIGRVLQVETGTFVYY